MTEEGSNTALIEHEEDQDMFEGHEYKSSENDPVLENVRLDLSQLEARCSKKPRIHWAHSPLSKESMKVSSISLEHSKASTGNGEEFLKKLMVPKGDYPGGDAKGTKALRGLLRSASKTSSPLSDQGKAALKHHYQSPLNPGKYIATTAPSSDSTVDNSGTPTKPMAASSSSTPQSRLIVDIEDLAGAVGSSFFSDTEIMNSSGTPAAAEDFILNDIDFDEFLQPIEDIPCRSSFGTIHQRIIVYTIEHDPNQSMLRISGSNLTKKALDTFYVSGDWMKCFAKQPPFTIHAVFERESLIDNDSGYIVVCPDTLISATLVADSITCSRRAVLSSRTQASVEDNKPSASLICGSIVHEVIEKALVEKEYCQDFLFQQIPPQIQKSLLDIFCADTDDAEILTQVQGLLDKFPSWAQDHLVGPPGDTQQLFISDVLHVEENLWSHGFGLKGRIDGTVIMDDRVSGKVFLAPFELKTGFGTTSVAHRAQAILYSFMLWDRYHVQVENSLLFYIAKGELFRLEPSRVDSRSLLMARNVLALQMENTNSLPPIISGSHACSRCFQLETCTLAHKILESGTAEKAPKQDYYLARTGHLDSVTSLKLLEFFEKWNRLVTLEEQEAVQARQGLLTTSIDDKIAKGSCLSSLVLVSCEARPEEEASSFAGFLCTFKKSLDGSIFEQNQFSTGDPVVVSASDHPIFGLAVGYFKSTASDHVTVVVDRSLIDISDEISRNIEQATRAPVNLFRIDKDELVTGFGLLRTNILKLGAPEAQKLMRLIVMNHAPTFSQAYLPTIPSRLMHTYSTLDTCQKEVVEKILRTQDYLLVLGMPGTGKSTTLCFVIQLLILFGKTILLSSHTHSAVDNILIKLIKSDPELRVTRLGNPDKISPALKKWTFSEQRFETLAQLEAFYLNSRLVACTCLGANHQLLQKRRFDICIMDEASQVNVPASLGSLRLASSFVLVGDHYQLPPLVRSKVAMDEGLNSSLFSILAESHPEAIAMLRLQYRMNSDIMEISNRLVYGGLLACGNEGVGSARLALKAAEKFGCSKGCSSCWLSEVLDSNRTVAFLDTDLCVSLETPTGNSFSNPFEAEIVHAIISGLTALGLDEDEISVISPYRSQLKLLTDWSSCLNVRFSTVDKFQGLDADCIIISLVRSNPEQNIGQLLRDWNRLNVAFTRARKKLLLVGSGSTILKQEMFRNFFDLFKERQWIRTLPVDALSHSLARL